MKTNVKITLYTLLVILTQGGIVLEYFTVPDVMKSAGISVFALGLALIVEIVVLKLISLPLKKHLNKVERIFSPFSTVAFCAFLVHAASFIFWLVMFLLLAKGEIPSLSFFLMGINLAAFLMFSLILISFRKSKPRESAV